MNLFKYWFLKYLNWLKILKAHVFKYLGFVVLLRECLSTSLFSNENPFFTVNYSVDICFEIFDVKYLLIQTGSF